MSTENNYFAPLSQIPANDDIDESINVKKRRTRATYRFLNTIVSWEYYQNTSKYGGIVQCHRCQTFEKQKPNIENHNTKCTNSKESHQASSTKCKVGAEYIELQVALKLRKDRENGGHGFVGIFVKRGIKNHIFSNLYTEILETISIKILSSSGDYLVIAAYFKGGNSNSDLNTKFKRDLSLFSRLPYKYLLIGDLNCRYTFWNCIANNHWWKILHENTNNMKFHNIFSIYTNTFSQNFKRKSFNNRQNFPVLFDLDGQPQKSECDSLFNFAMENWKTFLRYIEQNLPNIDIDTKQDIDEYLSRFISLLNNAAKCLVLILKIKPANKNKLLPNIHDITSSRNMLLIQWQRNRNGNTKKLLLSNAEKASALADFFSELDPLARNPSDSQTENAANLNLRTLLSININTNSIHKFTSEELKNIIETRKDNKSPGEDGINNEMLKMLPK
ncbi:uncharacterized protein LOC129616345 [Condylostylus longicornis]|uniref:uncharacterized protein LOC129616345 n=1 Tax=Condylostylus longicornis TaxID=2530218 RepID=UPI00244E48B4|nr:uncharacterized protein LOC129616345 [Condylostylus longicornis]